MFGTMAGAHAANSLQNAEFVSLPGNKAQITLTLSSPATTPLTFTIDNPARIALDFPETTSGLVERSQNIGIGMAESMTVVEAKGRTRVVVNLTEMVPYEAHADGNKVVLTVQNAGRDLSEAEAVSSEAAATGNTGNQISNGDFRRGEGGEGRYLSPCLIRPYRLICRRGRYWLIFTAQAFRRTSHAAWMCWTSPHR
jgi:type IV pilus assembly protein PilQ